MQRLGTHKISQDASVHQYQVEDASPGTHCLKPPLWFPPVRPATGDETDSSHISTQLDGVFVITTQQGSDRGRKQQRERWWSGGSSRGGEELGLERKEERVVGCWEVPRERTVARLPRCLWFLLFFCMHACEHQFVCVLTLSTQGQRVDNNKKLMRREN